jgi:hypothetical protein
MVQKLLISAIPSTISMSDFGFGHHPARLAVAWHPGFNGDAVI